MTVMTSEYMHEHPDEVLDAAAHGPVCVTENRQKAYVLMSADAYKQMIGDAAFSALLSKQANEVSTD